MLVPEESAGVGRVCSGDAEDILLSGAGKGTAGERRQLGDKYGKTELGVGETCVSSPDSLLLLQTQISLFRLLRLRI